ncbi:hypothetical protein PILCRDRAFT_12912 [Piloderma croceum F 1598]|uniref:Uncharacterized protein n=1 Tax=Piloderma croceum (strain F 1598) TaxID=765440 RepID=A0A0C3F8S1_PILCF|nr:hypothetical protein PILCRDRAFT_12912 [Piloderma croceum F 1598]
MPQTMILWRNVWKLFTVMTVSSFVLKKLNFTLLKTISAAKKDKKKKDEYEDAYQDSVTAPLGCEYYDDAVGQNDGNSEANDMPESEDPKLLLTEVFSAIEKCRQAWLTEVTISLRRVENALKETALMLTLDVQTQWASTH